MMTGNRSWTDTTAEESTGKSNANINYELRPSSPSLSCCREEQERWCYRSYYKGSCAKFEVKNIIYCSTITTPTLRVPSTPDPSGMSVILQHNEYHRLKVQTNRERRERDRGGKEEREGTIIMGIIIINFIYRLKLRYWLLLMWNQKKDKQSNWKNREWMTQITGKN